MLVKILAPFTDSQIKYLEDYQRCRVIHPYTCGNDKCRDDLIPTKDGWICKSCNYTQNWALHPQKFQ